jgi:hypothetical protein
MTPRRSGPMPLTLRWSHRAGARQPFGWFYGTDRWPDGEFFRYQITDLTLVR